MPPRPPAQGVLFDRPYVVREAPPILVRYGVVDRVTTQAGDFFESVPGGHDGYLLSSVIHDWDDARCLRILSQVRQAMDPAGRVLLVEAVIPAGNHPHPAKLLDLQMLLVPGGQERSLAEPWFLGFRADVRLGVAMTPEDLKKAGLDDLGKKWA
jgi:hypothetical protein